MLDAASSRRLAEVPLAWLTTVRADGQPQSSYVWFHHDGEDIVLLSRPTAAKLSNIRANPRVAFNLDGDQSTGGGVLTLEATAEVLGNLSEPRWEAYRAKYEPRIAKGPWKTPAGFIADFSTAVRLVPLRVRSW